MTIREQVQATGIRRSGGPRNGFRYRRARGGAVSAADRRRIAGLNIPTGWIEVCIDSTTAASVACARDTRSGAARWHGSLRPCCGFQVPKYSNIESQRRDPSASPASITDSHPKHLTFTDSSCSADFRDLMLVNPILTCCG